MHNWKCHFTLSMAASASACFTLAFWFFMYTAYVGIENYYAEGKRNIFKLAKFGRLAKTGIYMYFVGATLCKSPLKINHFHCLFYWFWIGNIRLHHKALDDFGHKRLVSNNIGLQYHFCHTGNIMCTYPLGKPQQKRRLQWNK